MIPLAALLLLVLIGLGLPVAAALALLGVTLGEIYAFLPILPAAGEILWSASTEFVLVAVPMFVLMGELLLRSGIAREMYAALDGWVNRIPGGLMHTNIASCTLFSATTGSSVATAATIGTVAVPNMTRLGYAPALYLGSIAAGGTLGILIPPSINMILYGVLAEVSITRLYLAALIPGIILAMLFSLAVLVACLLRPELDGRAEPADWRARIAGLRALAAPLGLFLVVVGSIYAGIATPTEAAALGVVAALGLAALRGALTRAMLVAALEGTMRTTAMVMLIVLAAFFLNFVMVSIGLTRAVTDAMIGLDLPPMAVMLILVALYLVLGCFMETLSLMVATTPVVVPVVTALGHDPVWFGVLFMILIEAALITPPIGVNLFVVQGVRAAAAPGPIRDVMLGAAPFLIMMLAMILALLALPGLALWLPGAVMG
ncbi:MAG: TRAP transporter large permease [Alphaproteobacteria bacterium]|nr:MAG: TRAP transporter large permease [Alphaproteobacteria bacterium]